MLFPHCFLSFHPNPALTEVLLSPCWLSSLWLVQVLSPPPTPPCNLKLGMLNSGPSTLAHVVHLVRSRNSHVWNKKKRLLELLCVIQFVLAAILQIVVPRLRFKALNTIQVDFFWHIWVFIMRLLGVWGCTVEIFIYGLWWRQEGAACGYQKSHSSVGLLGVCFVSSSAPGWRTLSLFLYAGHWLRKDDKLLWWLSAVC